ncbi:Hypothetical predicted protein, partial [Pelobates cultripes]
FIIKDFITCFSKNVIYFLRCPCGLQYVGRTIRPLHKRIYEHVNNITRGYEQHSVSAHFKKYHNKDPSGFPQFIALNTQVSVPLRKSRW